MNSISQHRARRFAFVSYWVSKCNSQFDGTCHAYTADSSAVDVTNFTSELWNPIIHGSVIESTCCRTVCRVLGKLIVLHAFHFLRRMADYSAKLNLWGSSSDDVHLGIKYKVKATIFIFYAGINLRVQISVLRRYIKIMFLDIK